MISFLLDVDDLADTRFAVSPLQELMGSLWTLRTPGRHPVRLPWAGTVLSRLRPQDTRLLLALVGPRLALPDFLTPPPAVFTPTFEDQLALVRRTPRETVRRDLVAAHAPAPVPEVLRPAIDGGPAAADRFLGALCDLLAHYWDLGFRPHWQRMRLALEADITYRARHLVSGGARLLFDELHPNLRWENGALHIRQMIGRHQIAAQGRGLPLVPSLFAYKPVPPLSPDEPPMLAYPSRGGATVWEHCGDPDPSALDALIGVPKARLLHLLGDGEALPTAELARRTGVTPGAVSQHLRVLHETGLVTRTRAGRYVLYRRTELGERLAR